MGNWQQTLSVYNLRDITRFVLSGLGPSTTAQMVSQRNFPPDPTLESFFKLFEAAWGFELTLLTRKYRESETLPMRYPFAS